MFFFRRLEQIFLGLLIAASVGTAVSAQKAEIGAGVGALNYTGDISTRFKPRFFRPGGDLFFRYNLRNGFSFRADVTAGLITAADKHADNTYQRDRDLAFRTFLAEGSVITEYNFLDYRDQRKAVNWTPYVLGGLGYTFFRPSPKTGSYKQASLAVPFGVGVKYEVSRPWSIGLEFAARKTFTDYLDNFGNEQISPVKYENGNPALKDMYYYLRFSVSYTFYKIVCP